VEGLALGCAVETRGRIHVRTSKNRNDYAKSKTSSERPSVAYIDRALGLAVEP